MHLKVVSELTFKKNLKRESWAEVGWKCTLHPRCNSDWLLFYVGCIGNAGACLCKCLCLSQVVNGK